MKRRTKTASAFLSLLLYETWGNNLDGTIQWYILSRHCIGYWETKNSPGFGSERITHPIRMTRKRQQHQPITSQLWFQSKSNPKPLSQQKPWASYLRVISKSMDSSRGLEWTNYWEHHFIDWIDDGEPIWKKPLWTIRVKVQWLDSHRASERFRVKIHFPSTKRKAKFIDLFWF